LQAIQSEPKISDPIIDNKLKEIFDKQKSSFILKKRYKTNLMLPVYDDPLNTNLLFPEENIGDSSRTIIFSDFEKKFNIEEENSNILKNIEVENIFEETEKDKLDCLNKRSKNISVSTEISLKYIKNQTNEMCVKALEKNVCAYLFIKEITPDLLLRIVKNSPDFIYYFTYNDILTVLKQNGLLLKYVDNTILTDEIYMTAVSNNGLALEYVKIKTKELCYQAVKRNGTALQFVDKELIDEDICRLAIEYTPNCFKFVPEKLFTFDFLEYAINKNCVFDFSKLTPTLIDRVIQNNGLQIRNFSHTPQRCLSAVKNNGLALLYIQDLDRSDELCEQAVKQNGMALKYVENQTLELYLYAIKQNPNAVKFIIDKNIKDVMEEIIKEKKFTN